MNSREGFFVTFGGCSLQISANLGIVSSKLMIIRSLLQIVRGKLGSGKVILVLGPRQTGKTTLMKELTKDAKSKLWLNCDEPISRANLESANLTQLKQLIGSAKTLVIDEAQRVKNIGLTIKLIADEINDVQVLVSGSSALELANEFNEPLTGRKWEYHLYPISWEELVTTNGLLEAQRQLELRLVYGMYPEVINNLGNEREVLTSLAGSYLYKDLLAYKGLRKPELLDKLLKALALQLGQEVSFNELSNLLQVDKGTVSEYINLLEQAFIIMRLQPLSRNLRNEISSSRKIYFWDTGIRNAIIGNYAPLSQRNDVGALWENFLISERIKFMHYGGHHHNHYFWRTHAQQEIDYVEERDGRMYAFEFKWNPKSKKKIPKTFGAAYPQSTERIITPENFDTFVQSIQ